MTKYLIKEVVTGTENNPNFAGVKKTCYLGKGHMTNTGRMIIEDGNVTHDWVEGSTKLLAIHYGFESERACKVGIAAERKNVNEEAATWGHHTFELEVYPVEIL